MPQSNKKIKKSPTSFNNPYNFAIILLEEYKLRAETEMYVNYILTQLNLMSLGELSELKLNDLAEKLHKWSKDTETKESKESKEIQSFFSKTLLSILRAIPKNVEDFATGENIKPFQRLMTSDNYQFNIFSLVKWINEKKCFKNPYTNLFFSDEDQKLIKIVAKENGLRIKNPGTYRLELTQHSHSSPPNPTLSIETTQAPSPLPLSFFYTPRPTYKSSSIQISLQQILRNQTLLHNHAHNRFKR